ncbi:hypothetical protein Shyhy01_54400 [Streptomyces hygroscopicus subsp. hygroscopicus]|uniref:esterase/lipase family protein n=1 Tax=Streptomyces sp. KHY 26 TaxID=3097359 RepID=UPI0024A16DE4|nr:hypothetical protein [Streptomyces hygroscopicus]GLX52490.1 hypothetical protein Shyhy01_54400 [Streptomyces hygroscopicus subsp. hygroscopicus]
MSPQQDASEPELAGLTLGDPLDQRVHNPVDVPPRDNEWSLPEGFAWVFHGQGNPGLVRPVIISDGFSLGRSELDKLYQFLESDYPFISELRRRGRDVILLGYNERTAAIQTNARAATAAILRADAEKLGGERLVVGGFSMGGLVTRYALAELESQRIDHQTGTYFSFDTPHRGATIPVGVQAFSYFIPFPGNAFARQMDSPAARQMLWQHYDKDTGKIGVAPERRQLLDELARLGGWPRIPRLLGVANGRGDGVGLPEVRPGETALRVERIYPGTTFYTQAQGDDVTAAYLNRRFPKAEKTITTNGFPEVDGAPGGTLHTYRILADALEKAGGTVDLRHPDICFVPTVSAVSVRDIGRQEDLYVNVDGLPPDESDLDDFLCSSTTTTHTAVTGELGGWLVDRLAY